MPIPFAIGAVAAALAYGTRGAVLPTPASAHALAATHRCHVALMADDDGPTLKCDVRKLPRSALALDLSVPAELANDIHLKTLAKMAKSTNMPGFRAGKVPPEAVIAKIGMQRVKEATVEQIVDVGMQQSGVGQRIQTVGDARLPEELENLAKRYVIGEPLEFTVEVDIYPECPVDEAKYKALEVDVEKVAFNQAGYDSALNKLRRQHADLEPTGAPAEEGHEVRVDMEGFLSNPDGSKGDALPAVAGGTDVDVPLEPGKFMPGLIEGLVGAKDGDVKEITVQFPQRSSVPQLAGREAIFVVTVKEVKRRVLPLVPSDDFANRVKPGMTYVELDEKLKEGVMADVDEQMKANTHKALTKALVATLPEEFEVPETLVDQITKEKFAMMLGDLREQGKPDEELKELVTPENYEAYKTVSRPMATASIKADFALKAVAVQQGLAVPEEQVEDELMTLQAQSVQRGEKFKASAVRPKVQQQLEKTLILDWLMGFAKISEVEAKDEADVSDILGASPEELAASIKANPKAASPPADDSRPTPPAAAKAAPTAKAAPAAAPAEDASVTTGKSPDGFEWGQTF